ncbi:MAG TPA: WavE lipopolysaccharide synthesis family protein [Solirubrobacteraceae bacterium]|nr:WavE lipopolysaccharide synthesis family protein [Solirubrobacteraceae bacterium]
MAGTPSWWEWYHRCLSEVGELRYFSPAERATVSGFDVVLVHEGLERAEGGAAGAARALAELRSGNRKLIWLEPHERSTFAASVFEPGFFHAVDLVVKYQLMEYAALVSGLRLPGNNLAPWALFGHTSIAQFYGNERLFGLPTSAETFDRHLTSDLSDWYGTQIVPMMRLFTLPHADSWYGGSPSRQAGIIKESQVGVTLDNSASASLRGALAGLLGQCGLDVKLHGSAVRAAATSEACVALGPVHLDGSAADVTRFETVAILPQDDRYLIWDDVFVPYETYLPMAGFGDLLRNGGRIIDGEAARRIAAQMRADLADAELRSRVLDGQRRAHGLLTDSRFVAARLGVPTTAPVTASVPARERVALRAAPPARIGGVSTDEISVVVQGAIGRDDTAERVVESARRHLPGCEIIVSTWPGERDLDAPTDRRVESIDPGAPWQVHEEWPSNTNRLLVSTRAGVDACSRPYALKLRSDSPLAGTGFLDFFGRYPARADSLRLLRDRIVVINFYCWNPDSRPYGLFSVADTVQFGRTEDVRAVWSRPLDDEPANSTWFETHERPLPDRTRWACFRYIPEQLLWLGFLRQHVDVPFEHHGDDNPVSRPLAELSLANNVVIVDPVAFGVELPRFANRPALEPHALYTHAMWRRLYDAYCTGRTAGPADGALARDPLAGARPFVILADAAELIAGEDLLLSYAHAMGGLGHTTLAIDASRIPVDTVEAELHGLVERCGLAERDDIDLLALIGPQDEGQRTRLVRRTSAIYAGQTPATSEIPTFTPATLGELRTLAERFSDRR